MIPAASFLPSRFRGQKPVAKASAPSWLSNRITALLQTLASLTSLHPIQTIVIVAVLASSTYLGLLEESLFDLSGTIRRADWSSLTDGSRSLRIGPETSWKWQPYDSEVSTPSGVDHLALVTFVFPESLSHSSPNSAPNSAPLIHFMPIPENLSITSLPSTANPLGAYSRDTALAFALNFHQAPQFAAAAQELPNDIPGQETMNTERGREKKMWIMKAASVHTRSSVERWFNNSWVEFVDLLKNAETLDIIIMVLGYLSMHLTFVSLFVSMRRIGSKFWLGTSTLLSSTFAFLFGLIVTTKLGVPISVVLLSEGLPFLVVTIGFEKNIVLTQAVLSHALDHRRSLENGNSNSNAKGLRKVGESTTNVIQYAIQAAIKEKGYKIVKDYIIEITILVAGAASGVQGGLQQFCFLAAWILFFDGVLLFSFYTAILCIKLEINRIKRYVEICRALEDDGVSHRVAKKVAENNDWVQVDGKGQPATSIFGHQMESTSVPKFKVLMVSGFLIINVLNICTIPFRSTDSLTYTSSWAGGLGGVASLPPVDPFKVAASGLDSILENAIRKSQETVVTILTPIKYELEFPSIHYGLRPGKVEGESDDLANYRMGRRIVGSILKSLEDPILSKWIIVALAMSVALNGYLFNAARWSIKDPNVPDRPINTRDLADAQKFNDVDTLNNPLGWYIRRTATLSKPITPVTTDDGKESPATRAATEQGYPNVSHSPEEIEKLLLEKRAHELTDEEVVSMSLRGKIPGYTLEETLKDFTRAVKVRRTIISRTKATEELTRVLDQSKLPYDNYNWAQVFGACCENVIGFMPLPVGVAGPLVIDGRSYMIPMATTEGVLVASTSRGCKAINFGGGAVTVVTADGMTRGPCVTFETLERSGAAKLWLDSDEGQRVMKKAFNSTSRFARLQQMKTAMAGTNLYIRFKTTTGDAMGMNMISKGVEHALNVMANEAGFDDMQIVSLSGNYCIDKKPAAINWIEGRGKSVVAEAIIPSDVVKSVLKSDVDSLVELNINKNLIGSAMAASVGGFNAHAANIVAAIFLATGQDPAQVVESANCITIMKNLRGSLQISVSMPSIEVGTLGGGTILDPQGAMLDLLGVRGPHLSSPGENARSLACIIAASVLAGELSLCSALAAGHLVKAHMQHNRSAAPTRSSTPAPSGGAATPVSLSINSTGEKAVRHPEQLGASSPAAVERAKR